MPRWLTAIVALFAPRPTPAVTVAPSRPMLPPPTPAGADAAEFLTLVNGERHAGRPLAYDLALEADARANDAQQAIRGLGHYTFDHRGQVAAWNFADARSVLEGWRNSPGHWAILTDPQYTRIGVSHRAPFWTASLA